MVREVSLGDVVRFLCYKLSVLRSNFNEENVGGYKFSSRGIK